MTKQVEAVYENGLLRPLEPLPLEEHQRVTVVITEAQPFPERSHPDSDYIEAVQKEVASMGRVPTLEEIHKITSKDPTSWAEAIIAERENGSD
jgi:predicted DNA-binding antitoxin AbrB/MazE fold protein